MKGCIRGGWSLVGSTAPLLHTDGSPRAAVQESFGPLRPVAQHHPASLSRCIGKTTCAVFRMFDHWRSAFEAGEPLHQVFVTVSATLKEQVRCRGQSGMRMGLAVGNSD